MRRSPDRIPPNSKCIFQMGRMYSNFVSIELFIKTYQKIKLLKQVLTIVIHPLKMLQPRLFLQTPQRSLLKQGRLILDSFKWLLLKSYLLYSWLCRGSEHGVSFCNYPNQDQGKVEVHLSSALVPHIILQNVAGIYKIDLKIFQSIRNLSNSKVSVVVSS